MVIMIIMVKMIINGNNQGNISIKVKEERNDGNWVGKNLP